MVIKDNNIPPLKKGVIGGILFLLALVFLEFLLSFAPLEKYDGVFMPKSSYPLFVQGKGEWEGSYVTNPHFSEFLNWQTFPLEKDPDAFRIFVIGGSAAYAWPYVDRFGFTGYLRRALNEILPGKVEIINTAGMSYGSHRVLDVLQDVLLLEPDLVIVYSGNNEYVERNVLPSLQPRTGAVSRIGAILDSTNIYRAVRLALYTISPDTFRPPDKPDITDIRASAEFERGSLGRSSAIDRQVLANYRANLAAIKEQLASHNVKGIFCTVPVNIGGWLPTADDPQFASEDAAAKWLELYRLKEEAFRKNDLEQEAHYLEEMLVITPEDPGMRFNFGKVLWNLGRPERSYTELVTAKDLDVRPIRALSSFNETIRMLADDGQTIYLADLEKHFRDLYYKRIAATLFLDYCHFTNEGHKIVANMLLPVIQGAMRRDLPLEQLAGRIRSDTVSSSMDEETRAAELYAVAIRLQNNQRLEETIATYRKILEVAPKESNVLSNTLVNLGNIYLKKDELDEARTAFIGALEIHPENMGGLVALGSIELREKNFAQAEDYFQKAYSINHYSPPATMGLATVALQKGDIEKAVAYYERTLELGRDNYTLRRELAEAYLRSGDHESAVRNWLGALKFNPYDRETMALVEKYRNL